MHKTCGHAVVEKGAGANMQTHPRGSTLAGSSTRVGACSVVHEDRCTLGHPHRPGCAGSRWVERGVRGHAYAHGSIRTGSSSAYPTDIEGKWGVGKGDRFLRGLGHLSLSFSDGGEGCH